MGYNPLTGKYEPDVDPMTGQPKPPDVMQYIKDKYSPDARQKLVDENNQYDTTGAVQGALASLGTAFQGGNSLAAAQDVMRQRQARKDKSLTDFDTGKERAMKDLTFNRDEEKLARERDPNSEESKFAQEAAKRMGYKGDLAGITAEKFKGFSPVLEKMYEVEQRRLDRLDNREFQRSLLQDRQDEKQRLLDEKKEEKDLRLAVPGYERSGEVLPKEEEAMKFRKATATADQLKQKLNRMKELVQKNGSFEYGGEGGQEMESLATEIQLLGKSPELYELGVLAGPDLSLLQKITSDPSSLSSLFTRDSTRQKQLDSQMSSIDQKLGATAKSLGYRKPGMGKTIVKTQTNQKTGQKRIVYSDGSIEIVDSVAGGM